MFIQSEYDHKNTIWVQIFREKLLRITIMPLNKQRNKKTTAHTNLSVESPLVREERNQTAGRKKNV